MLNVIYLQKESLNPLFTNTLCVCVFICCYPCLTLEKEHDRVYRFMNGGKIFEMGYGGCGQWMLVHRPPKLSAADFKRPPLPAVERRLKSGWLSNALATICLLYFLFPSFQFVWAWKKTGISN